MLIYKNEQSVSGLAEQILQNRVISYASLMEPMEVPQEKGGVSRALSRAVAHLKSEASIDDLDLYFTKSIFVTTNWNKNDDVFGPDQTWAARHTPAQKRTNLDHDEKKIVGHITDSWAIDNEGEVLDDGLAVEDLPPLFHLANGAVIYKAWDDKGLIARTETLINDIEEGRKYVSMEVLFKEFGYAVMTPEGEYYIVDRNEETSFLTRHLRSYGGKGIFDGCKLGRYIKNMIFSGKGYVNQPANPFSVIFDTDQDAPTLFSAASRKNPFTTHNGVFISCAGESPNNTNKVSNNHKSESTSMSAETTSVDLLKAQNDEFKATIAELTSKVDELTKANSEAGIKNLESQIEDLQGKLEASTAKVKELTEKVEAESKAKAELETKLEDEQKAKAEVETKLGEIEAARAKADRVSQLVDGGIDKEVAEAKVELFSGLNDEQFGAIASELIEAKKVQSAQASQESESDENTDEDEVDESATAEVLDEVEETEETNLSAEASTDNTNELKDQLVTALASHLGYDTEDNE